MTAEDFALWLAAMRAAGRARSDAECGRLLGVTQNTILAYKTAGTDLRTALACAALAAGMAPWSQSQIEA